MKAMLSEEYYEKYWDEFIQPVPGDHYINMEAELDRAMSAYSEIGLDDGVLEQAYETIRKLEATKIYNRATELVHKELDILEQVEAGTSGFGFTTESQEWSYKKRFHQRFEFNCYQRKKFREKYLSS